MSRRIDTPVNQKRLTNVAVVRLKRCGIRFEVACYKNKVMMWRQQVEKNLDEVLQIRRVFTNVSKGQFAKAEELIKAFGKDNSEEICLEILAKGELQVSEGERNRELGQLQRDVTSFVTRCCVNPETQRPVTMNLVDRALRDLHFNLTSSRPAKTQALELIRRIEESGRFPCQRARMRMRMTFTPPEEYVACMKEKLTPLLHCIESEDQDTEKYTLICQIDPGSFRAVERVCQDARGKGKGKGAMEVLSLAVMETGECDV